MWVTIAMPCLNRLDYTKRTVEALVANTDMGRVQLVGIDDGSNDGTAEWMSWCGHFNRVIVHPRNMGIATAVNNGWSSCPDADYFVKLDNDIIVKCRDWLDRMAGVFSAFPDAGQVGIPVVSPIVRYGETRVVESGGVHAITCNGTIDGGCMMLSRKARESGPLWQTSKPYGWEDSEISYRLRSLGFRTMFVQADSGELAEHLPEVRGEYEIWKYQCAAQGREEFRARLRSLPAV